MEEVTDEWWVLAAHQDRAYLRVQSAWTGRSGPGDFTLPDGRDEDDLVAHGDFADMPFPLWFEVTPGGFRAGDMIGTNGSGYKIVSARLLRALDELDAVGFLSSPADVRARDGRPLPGYHLLHALPLADGHEVRPFFGDLAHLWLFEVSARLHDELVERRIDDLHIRRARVVHDEALQLVTDPTASDGPGPGGYAECSSRSATERRRTSRTADSGTRKERPNRIAGNSPECT